MVHKYTATSTGGTADSYDANGDIGYRTGMADASGSTAWDYDIRGRLIREDKTVSGFGSFTTQWAYDSADQVIAMLYPNGENVSFSYLPQGGVNTVGAYLMGTQVDAHGQISLRVFGNGTQTSLTYADWLSNGGRLSSLRAGTPDTLLSFNYGYDAAGNITTIKDWVNSGQVQSFAYDALNRLTTASTDGVGEGQYAQSYGYDPATGNLASKSDVGAYSYLPAKPHAVTLAGANSYAYDQNGNMTSRTVDGVVWTYAYNTENQLITTHKNNQLIMEYGYDGDGKRVWAKDYEGYLPDNPRLTVYIGNYYEARVEGYRPPTGGDPVQPCIAPSFCVYFPLVVKSAVENVSYYYADGQRIAMKKDGMVYYLYGDQLGSVSAVADGFGAMISRSLYEPWGVTRYQTGSNITDYGFTGQMLEGDVYFYNARWYDPVIGRFMQADTLVPPTQGTQGFDRYAYVNNSPIKYTDPSGRCIFTIFDFTFCFSVGAPFAGHVLGEYIVQKDESLNQNARDRIGGALVTELTDVINTEASRTGIPAELISAVIRHESGALERRIFFNGPLANLAEGGEAYFRDAFSIGSASIGIGQIQVSIGSTLENEGYVTGNNKSTISNLLNPKTSVGYVAGYLSYIRTNLVKEYGNGFTALSLDDQSRILLQGYNMGTTGLKSYLANHTISDLLKYQNYHRQTLDEYRRWRDQIR